jgi:hypothetical protein
MGTYKNDWPAHGQHIPTDGVIVSPGVEIFRGGTDQGYKVHTNAVAVAAVVSVAMYNKNHSVRDAPMDAPKDAKAYEDGIRKKFTAMIPGAALSSADAIIIPDVGCGVFHNDPRDCGRVVGEVLAGYQSRFKSVVFTGDPAFYKAALDGFASGANAAPSGTSVRRGSCCLKSPEAHLYVGTCVICGNGLGGSDFSELALLLDKSQKKSRDAVHAQYSCMHGQCKTKISKAPANVITRHYEECQELLGCPRPQWQWVHREVRAQMHLCFAVGWRPPERSRSIRKRLRGQICNVG